MAGPEPAIRLKEVSKAFGSNKILDGVSFDVATGKGFCILGPSGTGKSVTLKLIIRLLTPDRGEIYIRGQEITRMEAKPLGEIRKGMGFLFQNAALFDSITLGENVAFPLRRHRKMSEGEIREAAEQKLAQVGLEEHFDKMPSELSGGMRKRASLARAMALEPPILLVDEPSAGLDPITAAEIDELLLDLKLSHNTTLVVVTHNIPSAKRLGDELMMLTGGSILCQGTVAEMEQSDNEIVQRFMKAGHGG